MVEVNKRLVFSAMSGIEGFEPHVLELSKLMTPIAQSTGRGCPGFRQLAPRIGAQAAPTVGNRGFQITLQHTVSNAPFVLGLAVSRNPVTVRGCSLEILPLLTIAGRATGRGSAVVAMGIPNNPALLGQEAVVQFAVGDRAGQWPGGIALSPALRIVVGR